MTKLNTFDVVHILDDDAHDTYGTIMMTFPGVDDYRTDARGMQHKDNLMLAPIDKWEEAYEIMAKTLNEYHTAYNGKFLKSFFDRTTMMFPNNDKLKFNPKKEN